MPISQTGARMDTEADDYLNEWREVSLTSVADIRFSSVNKVSQPGEEPVRLCNYTDVYNNDYVTADMDFMRATATKSEIERFGLQVGDVIITKDSETPDDIGIPTVVDTTAPDLVCGYHLALLRPNQDEVDPTFLAKQLAHHRIARYFGQQANGTTRYGLSTAAIANAPLHLPRPENQRTASALMRMVDAQISQTETVIAKLKQVRAGMLHDLLSYGLDEHGQLRDPIAHPEQFKDSPLGLIPREWEVVKLGDAFSMQAGKFLSSGNIKNFGHFPVFGGNGLRGYTTTYTHEGEYALIGRQGALCGNIMVASGQFYATEHAVVVTPNEEMNVGWVASYLTAMNLNRFSESSAQPGLSVHKLSHNRIKLPKFPEQEAIDFQIKAIDQQLSSEADALAKLGSLKSGLQDDLLTGRVSVPETIMEGAENA